MSGLGHFGAYMALAAKAPAAEHTDTATLRAFLEADDGREFVLVLVAHGGHPIVAVRKVGGYIDAWNTPVDPGWTIASMVRYRSRRDLMQLATDPSFTQAYVFKAAAVAETFSFPSQVVSSMALRPRVAVALSLALCAAIAHLASLLLQSCK